MTTALVPINRPQVRLLHVGAGAGTRNILPEVARLQGSNDPHCTIVDHAQGKAQHLATQARAYGVPATWHEARAEDVLDATPHDIAIVQPDRADTLAAMMEKSKGTPVFAYLHVKAGATLYSIRMICQAHEDEQKQRAAALYRHIHTITARGGSEQIFGRHARAAHRVTQPRYLRWQREHVRENLPNVLANREPKASAFEITDGRRTMQLFITEPRPGWAAPEALAHRIVDHVTTVVNEGEDFVVAELGPAAIRFHHARVRVTDGQIAVRGSTQLASPQQPTAGPTRHTMQLQRTAHALRRALRRTRSRLHPLRITD